jgi:hypothetical protein
MKVASYRGNGFEDDDDPIQPHKFVHNGKGRHPLSPGPLPGCRAFPLSFCPSSISAATPSKTLS